MASSLIGIQVPGNRLRVRVPCPPLVALVVVVSRWIPATYNFSFRLTQSTASILCQSGRSRAALVSGFVSGNVLHGCDSSGAVRTSGSPPDEVQFIHSATSFLVV